MMNMVVDHCRYGVMGGSDGMKIPGEMKVDILHGNHLGIPAAGGSPFDPHTGTEGGLPKGDSGPFSNPVESLPETDRDG